MKTWSMLAAVLVLGFCASVAVAAGAEKHTSVRGKVTKIDGANITVQGKAMGGADAKAPEPKTFATDDKTVVTAGSTTGEKKTVADIKVDDIVIAALSEDGKTATHIVLNPTRKPKPKPNATN